MNKESSSTQTALVSSLGNVWKGTSLDELKEKQVTRKRQFVLFCFFFNCFHVVMEQKSGNVSTICLYTDRPLASGVHGTSV